MGQDQGLLVDLAAQYWLLVENVSVFLASLPILFEFCRSSRQVDGNIQAAERKDSRKKHFKTVVDNLTLELAMPYISPSTFLA